MKQIVVISGKGGTGKTIFTASLASLAKNKVMVDCDVDAADLHLLLSPRVVETHEFRSGKTAWIDPDTCIACGECAEVCRFDAIRRADDHFVVDPLACEGCGLCARICPVEVVAMRENICGQWYLSDTPYGPFVHARLGIAQENSGKLVACIRQKAKELAETRRLDYVIIDGPPGIGCPVLASLTDTNLAVIVTEPTLSGIHDARRVMELARHFRIPAGLVINKWDINPERSREIEDLCAREGVHLLGRIPFSKRVAESLIRAVPYVETADDEVSAAIRAAWDKIDSEPAGQNRRAP
ncbi:MAG: Ferredoxin [Syntrophaceae bacterium PtaB.Bin038]|nr:MAG: Ferredoxin [Syntrophaceae bacterium PtaB.Bin038]